jgi:hypothetical protein
LATCFEACSPFGNRTISVSLLATNACQSEPSSAHLAKTFYGCEAEAHLAISEKAA